MPLRFLLAICSVLVLFCFKDICYLIVYIVLYIIGKSLRRYGIYLINWNKYMVAIPYIFSSFVLTFLRKKNLQIDQLPPNIEIEVMFLEKIFILGLYGFGVFNLSKLHLGFHIVNSIGIWNQVPIFWKNRIPKICFWFLFFWTKTFA